MREGWKFENFTEMQTVVLLHRKFWKEFRIFLKIELEFSDEIRYYTDKVDVSLTKYRDSKLKFTF